MPRSPSPLRGRVVLLSVLAAAAACSSNPEKELQSDPAILYERAHRSLESQDFNTAIKIYEAMTARYPFAEESRQARLDLIYAYYRARESESAIDAAETFIRENPTHPRVDYAWYLKGLVDFERTPNVVERLMNVDLSDRPPQTARKSFAAFKTVVDQYPKSEYAYDSRLRMVYLRNRLADYSVNVADYYRRRGAWVAAAQRAKQTIEEFDGAPATRQSLEIMIESYDRLGLAELAEQSREVYAINYPDQTARVEQKKSWWKIW